MQFDMLWESQSTTWRYSWKQKESAEPVESALKGQAQESELEMGFRTATGKAICIKNPKPECVKFEAVKEMLLDALGSVSSDSSCISSHSARTTDAPSGMK